jgi:hypothetical protein
MNKKPLYLFAATLGVETPTNGLVVAMQASPNLLLGVIMLTPTPIAINNHQSNYSKSIHKVQHITTYKEHLANVTAWHVIGQELLSYIMYIVVFRHFCTSLIPFCTFLVVG